MNRRSFIRGLAALAAAPAALIGLKRAEPQSLWRNQREVYTDIEGDLAAAFERMHQKIEFVPTNGPHYWHGIAGEDLNAGDMVRLDLSKGGRFVKCNEGPVLVSLGDFKRGQWCAVCVNDQKVTVGVHGSSLL
jgi:hypothetical protein